MRTLILSLFKSLFFCASLLIWEEATAPVFVTSSLSAAKFSGNESASDFVVALMDAKPTRIRFYEPQISPSFEEVVPENEPKSERAPQRPTAVVTQEKPKSPSRSLSSLQREYRLSHAHELLGKYYRHSEVQAGKKVQKINSYIYKWSKEALPVGFQKKYKKVAQAIIDESTKYEFDPVFLMAVIQTESGFNPLALGSVGEIGLMQLRPQSAEWIAKLSGQKWKGKNSLKDPVTNIRLGAAYLSYLREVFDSHARLYLAAYNMGQTNVKNALDQKVWPKEYPARVMQQYIDYYSRLREDLQASQTPVSRKVISVAGDL